VDVGTSVHVRFDGVEQGARDIEALLTDARRWERASSACREHFQRTHSGAVTLERYGRLFEEVTA
jgi:hypothetical protein